MNAMSNLRRNALLVVFSLFFLCAAQSAGICASDPSTPEHALAGGGSGKVVETMNAGGYTYLLVDTGKEKTWVAIPESSVSQEETVEYSAGMVMQDFHSKTLDRTFAAIVRDGTTQALRQDMLAFDQFNELMGLAELRALEKRFP